MKDFVKSFALLLLVIFSGGCKNIQEYSREWNGHKKRNRIDDDIVIPEFGFKRTTTFHQKLSSYSIYQGEPSDLNPAQDFFLLELSSTLFTDYSSKQRLIKLPKGQQLVVKTNDKFNFPDQTILVKTFYYFNDFRNNDLGKRILETRLLIKENGAWNAATYVWNSEQTDAFLDESGQETLVSWMDENGDQQQTEYHIPSKNECATCHQSQSKLSPIGPRIRNLNRTVSRDGMSLNQLDYLNSVGVLPTLTQEQLLNHIVDYKDQTKSLAERSRAYLDMNCAHCHNPNGWQLSGRQRFDFRNETRLAQTGIFSKEEKITRTLKNGKMPLLGTTMIDKEGVALISDYLKTLE